MDHPTTFPSSKSVNSSISKFVQLIVPGMGSNHCAGLITTSVERLTGIINLTTNIANHRVDVEFDANLTSVNQIRGAIEKVGYDVTSTTSSTPETGGEASLTVPGMGSDHCAGLVSSSIKRLAGITDISTNIANHKVTVRFDEAAVDAKLPLRRQGTKWQALVKAGPKRTRQWTKLSRSATSTRHGSACGSPPYPLPSSWC